MTHQPTRGSDGGVVALPTFEHKPCRRQVARPVDRGPVQGLLEPAGVVVVLTGGGDAVRVPSWRPHECPGAPPVGWMPEVRMTTQELREAAWAVAYPRPCPKCGAGAEEDCVNLAFKKTVRTTRWPHEERYPPGYDPDYDAEGAVAVERPWEGCPWHGQGSHVVEAHSVEVRAGGPKGAPVERRLVGERCTECGTTMNWREEPAGGTISP